MIVQIGVTKHNGELVFVTGGPYRRGDSVSNGSSRDHHKSHIVMQPVFPIEDGAQSFRVVPRSDVIVITEGYDTKNEKCENCIYYIEQDDFTLCYVRGHNEDPYTSFSSGNCHRRGSFRFDFIDNKKGTISLLDRERAVMKNVVS